MRKGIGIATLLAVAACAGRGEVGGGGGEGAATWTTTIGSVGAGGHSGSATVAPMGSGSHVTIVLAGGSAGGNHPWHVHEGRCGSNGPIVGSAADYPALAPDAQGDARAEAHVAVALAPEGDYHVNVHQSPTALGTIVGCGDLTR